MNIEKCTSAAGEVFHTFPKFLSAVYGESKNYAYTSIAERRCFNLVSHFFPLAERLYSNNGLLLHYKELAEEYANSGSFRSILVVDDLVIHGRAIGKFLAQLENAIRYALDLKTQEEKERLHYQLIDAVDIHAFARGKSPLLIEDGYLMKLHCDHSVYGVELRELTDLMSRLVSHSGIANTSFVFSAYWPAGKVPADEQYGSWKRVFWKHNNRHMCAYIRPERSTVPGKAQRISTVRYYSDISGGDKQPFFTSFTIFGDVSLGEWEQNQEPNRGLYQICRELCEKLPEETYRNLRGILQESNPYVQQSKGQLICLLLSILDFLDFAQEACEDLEIEELIENSDLDKISKNFGGGSALQRELEKFVRDSMLRESVKEIICRGLDEAATPLPCGDDRSDLASCEAASMDETNDAVRELFYQVGMRSERCAYEYSDASYRYPSDSYDVYTAGGEPAADLPGVGGVMSFGDYLNEMQRRNIPFYGSIAAYLILLDQGYIGGRMQASDEQVFTIIKAGERAMFHLPQKIDLFIPALALVEGGGALVDLKPEKAVEAFVKTLKYDGDSQEITSELKNLQNEIQTYTGILYQCGQSYSGWNFERLTRQTEQSRLEAQSSFVAQARAFLHMEHMK